MARFFAGMPTLSCFSTRRLGQYRTLSSGSLPPSIFNDVIGPVMRGPSSSHSAAAHRIGFIARHLMQSNPFSQFPSGGSIRAEYDPTGSLVTTHRGQGTDMGLVAGVLGLAADDERLMRFEDEASESRLSHHVTYKDQGAIHPNTYKLYLQDEDGHSHSLVALSTGGGMIEVVEVDGLPIHSHGDFHEAIVFLSCHPGEDLLSRCESLCQSTGGVCTVVGPHTANSWRVSGEPFYPPTPHATAIQMKTREQVDLAELSDLLKHPAAPVMYMVQFPPVLPVLSSQQLKLPFESPSQLEELIERDGGTKPLSEYGIEYEMARGGISRQEAMDRMSRLAEIMHDAVELGMKGTQYHDRILPAQAPQLVKAAQESLLSQIILYVTAIMEVKSSMGVIVAAPTAGSCGAMPGAVLATAHRLSKSSEELVEALFAAGLIGVFVQRQATFAAEVGGCMAECGAGSGMAAAAIAQLQGGTCSQALAAASLALQNSFGMTCDPIANRVEAPCLGKNTMAAANALSCATMATADCTALIPLEEVLDAMNVVGKQLPHELRCTGKGGLAITPTGQTLDLPECRDSRSNPAKRIEASLEKLQAGSLAGAGGGKVPC